MTILQRPYEISVWDNAWDNSNIVEKKICTIGSDTMSAKWRATEPTLKINVNGTIIFTFKMYTRYYNVDARDYVDNPMLQYLVNERLIKLHYNGEWYDLLIKKIEEDSDRKSFTYTCESLHITELSKQGYNIELNTELENNMGNIYELAEHTLEGTDWTVDREKSDKIRAYKKEDLWALDLSNLPESELQSIIATDMLNTNTYNYKSYHYMFIFYSSIQNYKEIGELEVLYGIDGEEEVGTKEIIIPKCTLDDDNIIISKDPKVYNCLVSISDTLVERIKNNYCRHTLYKGYRLVKQKRMTYDSNIKKYVDVGIDNTGKTIYRYQHIQYYTPDYVRNLIANPTDFTSIAGWQAAYTDGQSPTITVKGAGKNIELSVDNGSIINASIPAGLKTPLLSITNLGTNASFYNTGLIANASFLKNGFSRGEKYIFCTRLYAETNDFDSSNIDYDSDNSFQKIKEALTHLSIKIENSNDKTIYFQLNGNISENIGSVYSQHLKTLKNNDYITNSNKIYAICELSCENDISLEDLKTSGLYLTFLALDDYFTTTNKSLLIEDIMFFKKVEGEKLGLNPDGTPSGKSGIIFPGNLTYTSNFFKDAQNQLITKYRYYDPKQNTDIDNEDELVLLDEATIAPQYRQLYNNPDYLEVASIEISRSNRFNVIQSLCEKFECWAKFVIDHDKKGRIIKRSIQFKEYVGDIKYTGFKYGKNLKSVKRTIDSKQISTKTIVQDNNNQVAKDGFCTIARALDNPTRQNFILDFSYYLNQGLLDKTGLYNDLSKDFQFTDDKFRNSLSTNTYSVILDKQDNSSTTKTYSEQSIYDDEIKNSAKQGYLNACAEIADERDVKITDFSIKLNNYMEVEASEKTLLERVNAAEKELTDRKERYKMYTGLDYPNYTSVSGTKLHMKKGSDFVKENTDKNGAVDTRLSDQSFINIVVAIKEAEWAYKEAEEKHNQVLEDKNIRKAELDKLRDQISYLTTRLNVWNKAFDTKYRAFIQEGTWSSSDYYDDDLYFHEAWNVAETSAKPKITYNIDVVDISRLSDYRDYEMKVGDRTTIEDTEFFGYVDKVGTDGLTYKTPYREDVVVSEITYYFDSPEKDKIQVQNYKTQFNDLFKRIAATSQAISNALGKYTMMGTIIKNGDLNFETLQEALNSNSFALSNTGSSYITWDEHGITAIDTTSPRLQMRFTGQGLFLTDDGGIVKYGLPTDETQPFTIKYIVTEAVKAAEYDVNLGIITTFRWDSFGNSAYYWNYNNEEHTKSNVNTNNFIRYDQYGIYNIIDMPDFTAGLAQNSDNPEWGSDLAPDYGIKKIHGIADPITNTTHNTFYLLRDGTLKAVSMIVGNIEGEGGEFSGDLSVDGSGSFEGGLNVNGESTFKNDLNVEQDLNVDGNGQFNGDLNASGQGQFGSLDVTQDSHFGGDVTTDGRGTFNGGLDIGGITTFKDEVTFKNGIDVHGNSTFSGGNLTINDNLTVNGTSQFNDNVTVGSEGKDAHLYVDGDIYGYNGYFSGTLNVTKKGFFNQGIEVAGDSIFKNNLTVNEYFHGLGNGRFDLDFSVGGTTKLEGKLTVGSETKNADVEVYGYGDFHGKDSEGNGLVVDHNARIKEKLQVDGTSQFNDDVTIGTPEDKADLDVNGGITVETIADLPGWIIENNWVRSDGTNYQEKTQSNRENWTGLGATFAHAIWAGWKGTKKEDGTYDYSKEALNEALDECFRFLVNSHGDVYINPQHYIKIHQETEKSSEPEDPTVEIDVTSITSKTTQNTSFICGWIFSINSSNFTAKATNEIQIIADNSTDLEDSNATIIINSTNVINISATNLITIKSGKITVTATTVNNEAKDYTISTDKGNIILKASATNISPHSISSINIKNDTITIENNKESKEKIDNINIIKLETENGINIKSNKNVTIKSTCTNIYTKLHVYNTNHDNGHWGYVSITNSRNCMGGGIYFQYPSKYNLEEPVHAGLIKWGNETEKGSSDGFSDSSKTYIPEDDDGNDLTKEWFEKYEDVNTDINGVIIKTMVPDNRLIDGFGKILGNWIIKGKFEKMVAEKELTLNAPSINFSGKVSGLGLDLTDENSNITNNNVNLRADTLIAGAPQTGSILAGLKLEKIKEDGNSGLITGIITLNGQKKIDLYTSVSTNFNKNDTVKSSITLDDNINVQTKKDITIKALATLKLNANSFQFHVPEGGGNAAVSIIGDKLKTTTNGRPDGKLILGARGDIELQGLKNINLFGHYDTDTSGAIEVIIGQGAKASNSYEQGVSFLFPVQRIDDQEDSATTYYFYNTRLEINRQNPKENDDFNLIIDPHLSIQSPSTSFYSKEISLYPIYGSSEKKDYGYVVFNPGASNAGCGGIYFQYPSDWEVHQYVHAGMLKWYCNVEPYKPKYPTNFDGSFLTYELDKQGYIIGENAEEKERSILTSLIEDYFFVWKNDEEILPNSFPASYLILQTQTPFDKGLSFRTADSIIELVKKFFPDVSTDTDGQLLGYGILQGNWYISGNTCNFVGPPRKGSDRVYGGSISVKINGQKVATETSSSDFRFKNSISSLSDQYSTLFDNLKPVRYKKNNGTSGRYHIGFVAQDVEQAIETSGVGTQNFGGFVINHNLLYDKKENTHPIESAEKIIQEGSKDDIITDGRFLRYDEFIALNTNEIQKLKKRVKELEERISLLEKRSF